MAMVAVVDPCPAICLPPSAGVGAKRERKLQSCKAQVLHLLHQWSRGTMHLSFFVPSPIAIYLACAPSTNHVFIQNVLNALLLDAIANLAPTPASLSKYPKLASLDYFLTVL